jgi:hypothetical protein
MGASKAGRPRAMGAVHRALLLRTPVAAERVLYLGEAGPAFADAIRARNPKAEVLLGDTDAAAVEVLAADNLGRLLANPAASALLERTEVLATAIGPAEADPGGLLADLTARGFTSSPPKSRRSTSTTAPRTWCRTGRRAPCSPCGRPEPWWWWRGAATAAPG